MAFIDSAINFGKRNLSATGLKNIAGETSGVYDVSRGLNKLGQGNWTGFVDLGIGALGLVPGVGTLGKLGLKTALKLGAKESSNIVKTGRSVYDTISPSNKIWSTSVVPKINQLDPTSKFGNLFKSGTQMITSTGATAQTLQAIGQTIADMRRPQTTTPQPKVYNFDQGISSIANAASNFDKINAASQAQIAQNTKAQIAAGYPVTAPKSIVENTAARPTGPVTATKPGTKATITNSNATTGGTSSGSTAAGNTTDNSAAAWAAAREKELADMKKLADAKSATPDSTNNSTGNTAGTTTDQGGTITMDMTQTDQAANAASAAAQASYNAGLASLAQQSYANQIALRDALATNMQQSQGQAADIYGGTAPALLGQFITGDQRGYVQGVSGETQRSVTQQNALLQAYNDNVAQIAQAKANAYASAAAKKAALAAQIKAMG